MKLWLFSKMTKVNCPDALVLHSKSIVMQGYTTLKGRTVVMAPCLQIKAWVHCVWVRCWVPCLSIAEGGQLCMLVDVLLIPACVCIKHFILLKTLKQITVSSCHFYWSLVKGNLRTWVMHYVYESLHKDRSTRVCVCVFVHVCVICPVLPWVTTELLNFRVETLGCRLSQWNGLTKIATQFRVCVYEHDSESVKAKPASLLWMDLCWVQNATFCGEITRGLLQLCDFISGRSMSRLVWFHKHQSKTLRFLVFNLEFDIQTATI